MQIYTKIFIGMALGIVAGFCVGPQSPWLSRDLVLVRSPARVTLLDAPAGSRLPKQLPEVHAGKGPPLRAAVLGSRHSGRRLYYQLRFRVSKRLALADKSGRMKVGAVITGWVAAENVAEPVSSFGDRFVAWVAPVGVAFLKLIKMVIVPLVFASLLVGVASLGDPRRLGRLGGKTLGYFLLTTTIAITIGLAMANVVKPGRYISGDDRSRLVEQYGAAAKERSTAVAEQPSAVDNVLGVIPENPIDSMASGNMLQIIFFALFLGIALTLVPQEKAKKVIVAFEALNDAMVKIVEMIMKLAPYGVFALVAKVVGESGLGVLKALTLYAVVVIVALGIHALAVYTSVVRLFGRIRAVDFWRAIRPAQLIGFSTSSSSATLPVTMECAEKNLGVSNRIASFVLPLGSTVNMDGTALYQGVAAVFIAQVFGIHLTLGDQLNVVLTATLASIGAAGVPGVGMITLALVLTSIGVPTVGLALILGVDRILDMFRTAVNITGDLSATVMVAATEGEKLRYVAGQSVGMQAKSRSAAVDGSGLDQRSAQ